MTSATPFPASQGTIPDLAFCDSSPWDFEKADKAGISGNMVSYISHQLYPFGLGESKNNNFTLQREYEEDYQKLLLRYNGTIGVLDAVTRDCASYLIYCNLPGMPDVRSTLCCSKYFNEPIYRREKKCFSTVGKLNQSQAVVNELESIESMTVAIKSSVKNSGYLNRNFTNSIAMFSSSFHVAIVDEKMDLQVLKSSDFRPLTWKSTNLISVRLNLLDQTNVARVIDAVKCSPDPGYSKHQCMKHAMQKETGSQFNCSSVTFGAPTPGTKFCTPAINALIMSAENKKKGEIFNQGEACLDQCKLNYYSFEVRPENIRSGIFSQYGMNESKYEFMMLRVFYEASQVHLTIYTGKSMQDVISGIGGTLGLCIGGSLITIVELGIYFLQCRRLFFK